MQMVTKEAASTSRFGSKICGSWSPDKGACKSKPCPSQSALVDNLNFTATTVASIADTSDLTSSTTCSRGHARMVAGLDAMDITSTVGSRELPFEGPADIRLGSRESSLHSVDESSGDINCETGSTHSNLSYPSKSTSEDEGYLANPPNTCHGSRTLTPSLIESAEDLGTNGPCQHRSFPAYEAADSSSWAHIRKDFPGLRAAACKHSPAARQDALEMLNTTGLLTTAESQDLSAKAHVDECIHIALEMLQTWPVAMWTQNPAEAKKFFEMELTARYQSRLGGPLIEQYLVRSERSHRVSDRP